MNAAQHPRGQQTASAGEGGGEGGRGEGRDGMHASAQTHSGVRADASASARTVVFFPR
jgi:hypothetical protein